GEIQSNKEDYPKFDIEKLKGSVKEIKKYTLFPFLEQLENIKEILKSCGVSLVFEPHLPNTYVNGVSYKVSCDKAIIMISDRGKRDDGLWFTLFHEIGHLIKHSKKEVFVDMEDTDESKIEKEANDFARNTLLSDDIYEKFVSDHKVLNKDIIKDFSLKQGISPGILVGRLQKEEKLKWNEFNELITRI
ncbi:MAG TPA: hypothetical protein DCY94_04815, partial [Firmicutes bacterium]|nr:hypothetical protein [Bacillota bacterium]